MASVTAGVGADAPARELSAKEQALWLLQQLAPEAGLANLSLAVRFRPPLEAAPLEAALGWVVDRHPALRSRVRTAGDAPVRYTEPPGPGAVDLDVRSVSADRLADAVRRRAGEPFDLEREPPLRATHYPLGAEESCLLLTAHHIAFDLPSFQVVLGDLAAAYTSLHRHGRPPDLPPLEEPDPRPVAASEEARRYWREHLRGASSAGMALHGARTVAGEPSFRGQSVTRMLSPEGRTALRHLRRRSGATDNIVLLSVFLLLLLQHGASEDLVVAVPVTARRGGDRRVGYLVDTVALRVRPDPDAGFDRLVAGVRQQFLAALDHAMSYEELLGELRLHGGDWRAPLFRHMFTFWPVPTAPPRFSGSEGTFAELPTRLCRLDFEFGITAWSGTYRLQMLYNVEVHERWQIDALLERFETLLLRAAEQPSLPVRELRAWSASDAGRLAGANRTARDWGAETSLSDCVRAQVRARPGAVALVDAGGPVTYGQLWRQAAATRRALVRADVTPGEVVAVAGTRSAATAAGVLGIWAAGACYLPLDPTHPPDRLAAQLDDAGVRLVVGGGLPAVCLEGRRLITAASTADGAGETDGMDLRVDRGRLAYVIYTSGSTGRPKGVEISHGALLNVVRHFARELGLSPEDAVLWSTTFSFDISALELLMPLATGGRVVPAPDEALRDPPLLLDLVERHDVRVVQATPTLWRLVTTCLEGELAGRWAISGGELLSAPLARRLLESGCRLVNAYGPTETTIWSTAAEISDADAEPLPVGRPIANTRVHVLDDDGRPLPPGLPGEVVIGGQGLARGYRGRRQLTLQRFVCDDQLGRLYRTGDVGRWRPDGTIELLGRTDRQVKVRGHRLELGEVEAVLESHPDVVAAAAVLLHRAADDVRVAAAVQTPSGEALDEDLRRLAARKLPDPAVPSAVRVVPSLPTTANGKVDYRAVSELLQATSPAAGGGAAIGDGLTAEVARLFEAVLGTGGLSADANFFLEGGHSLLAMRLTALVAERWGVDLRLATVFRAPTPERLAQVIEEEGGRP